MPQMAGTEGYIERVFPIRIEVDEKLVYESIGKQFSHTCSSEIPPYSTSHFHRYRGKEGMPCP